ncbi:hypothetical protein B9479_003234, partial [Cryptococcus floricola]
MTILNKDGSYNYDRFKGTKSNTRNGGKKPVHWVRQCQEYLIGDGTRISQVIFDHLEFFGACSVGWRLQIPRLGRDNRPCQCGSSDAWINIPLNLSNAIQTAIKGSRPTAPSTSAVDRAAPTVAPPFFSLPHASLSAPSAFSSSMPISVFQNQSSKVQNLMGAWSGQPSSSSSTSNPICRVLESGESHVSNSNKSASKPNKANKKLGQSETVPKASDQAPDKFQLRPLIVVYEEG